jgi:TRAP-type C4-dicarboxylate transport system permease small subunit
MSDASTDARYRLDLPGGWQRFDRVVLIATRVALFLIGTLFTGMIVLEVVSRYLFDFSIFFINGAAQSLLVWFFLLGSGLALREGAHVGVELIVNAVSSQARRVLLGFVQALIFVFFCQMLWSAILAVPASLDQTEASTGISLVWVTLAFPVSFVLLIYHQITLVFSAMRARRRAPA